MTVNATLPGTDIGFAGSRAPVILPSAADTVAIPLVGDWGPVGTDPAGSDGLQGGPQLCVNFADYVARFGDSDTAGRTAAALAFAGQNLPGYPGAGGVLVHRIGGAGVAAATVQVTSTGTGTPAVLSISGYYKGTRGNRISLAVDADPSDATKDRVRIFFDGVLQESYTYNGAGGMTAQNLADTINSNTRRLVRVVALVPASAARLTQTGGVAVALAGGNDGATPTGTDHLAALSALEYKSFGVIAPYDLTNAGIVQSYLSWLQAQIDQNRPRRLVVGGAAGELVGDAVTRSSTLGHEHVLNVGCGTYHDDLLGKDLSTSQLAPRVAGILAAKGEMSAITFARIGGLHVVLGPADDEMQLAINGGVVALVPTTSPDAEVMILKGVTTYTQDSPTKPFDVFSDARLIGVMDDYIRAMVQWGNDKVVGDLPVNDDTRNLVRGQARKLQDALLIAGLILPPNPAANPPVPAPWVVCTDPGGAAPADTIPYSFGWKFARTANAITGQGAIS